MAKILISMRDEFLEKIDETADKEQRSRSELIRQAVRFYFKRRRSTPEKALSPEKALMFD